MPAAKNNLKNANFLYDLQLENTTVKIAKFLNLDVEAEFLSLKLSTADNEIWDFSSNRKA